MRLFPFQPFRFLALPRSLAALGAAIVLAAPLAPARATPVMEMRAEDLMPLSDELKKSLNLSPNQMTLWQQTEGKTRQLLRDRKARRERLQAATKAGVDGKNVELRDLVGAVDAETASSAAEEKLMREWWLTVNDALTESQRLVVVQQLGEQLLRVQDSGARPGAGEPRREGGEQHRNGGGRRGGMNGGVNGGPGGASISLPGG